jgi:hypothetical protein
MLGFKSLKIRDFDGAVSGPGDNYSRREEKGHISGIIAAVVVRTGDPIEVAWMEIEERDASLMLADLQLHLPIPNDSIVLNLQNRS